MRLLRYALFCLFYLTAAADLNGQQRASPFVPLGHWSEQAIERLHALGLVPAGTGRGQRSRAVAEIAAAFDSAAAAGSDLARSWQRRLSHEFATSPHSTAVVHAAAAGGAGRLTGDVRPGLYTTWGEENWTGARPRADRSRVEGRIALLATSSRWLAVGFDAEYGALRSRIDELYGTTRFGPIGVWGGRRAHGFGPGTSGLVLDGRAPFDGGGLFIAEPVRLPWLLRHLGPVRAEFAAGVLDPNGPVEQPWFVMTRGTIEPHPRFGIGVTRGGMIGPDEGARGVTDVLFFLIGGHTDGSEYDNQVVSVDGWLRAGGGPLPLLLYLEWGAEDAAGAWWDVPGILAGIEVSAVPGLRWLSLAVERTVLARSRSGNPPWYRHPIGFHEGWTSRGELLGHPLGGHGRELTVRAHATLYDARLELSGQGFTRWRGSENVYAPDRMGRSTGVVLHLDADVMRGLSLRAGGELEDGTDWRRSYITGMLQWHLPR